MDASPLRQPVVPPDDAGAPHRVLVVDDSVVARAVLMRVIDGTPGFVVAGMVADADAARAFLKANPVDVIILDIDMPRVSGLTALPDLLAAGRGARVLVVSSACNEGASTTVQALALGAADTLVKPSAGNFAGEFVHLLRERLKRLVSSPAERSEIVPIEHMRAGGEGAEVPFAGFRLAIMGIAASTGGIHALSQMLRQIPATMRAPMLITQHLPATFMPYFAAQVALISGRPCDVATDRMRVQPGRIYVAPGHAHMRCVPMLDSAAIRLSEEPAPSGCRPSADPMLTSLGDGWGPAALGVTLSGMGRDGAEGARRLKEAGGRLIAQDRESSVVWGMPGAVVRAGLADAVLAPDAIGRVIAAMGVAA